MDNNLTLFILSDDDVKTLEYLGYGHITRFRNKEVETRLAYETQIILSSVKSKKEILVKYTPEQIELLQENDKEFYQYLNNRIVGEKLHKEVFDYLKILSLEDTDENSVEC